MDQESPAISKILEYAKEKNYEFIDIDGIKVLFNDGWALVRASNTGPNITARFEANNEERLEESLNKVLYIYDKKNVLIFKYDYVKVDIVEKDI